MVCVFNFIHLLPFHSRSSQPGKQDQGPPHRGTPWSTSPTGWQETRALPDPSQVRVAIDGCSNPNIFFKCEKIEKSCITVTVLVGIDDLFGDYYSHSGLYVCIFGLCLAPQKILFPMIKSMDGGNTPCSNRHISCRVGYMSHSTPSFIFVSPV